MRGITGQELEILLAKEPIVVVDFFATWCGPCQIYWPIYEKVAKASSKIKLTMVDVDLNQESAMKYGVRSMPTTAIFVNGKLHQSFSGVISENDLTSIVRQLEKA